MRRSFSRRSVWDSLCDWMWNTVLCIESAPKPIRCSRPGRHGSVCPSPRDYSVSAASDGRNRMDRTVELERAAYLRRALSLVLSCCLPCAAPQIMFLDDDAPYALCSNCNASEEFSPTRGG